MAEYVDEHVGHRLHTGWQVNRHLLQIRSVPDFVALLSFNPSLVFLTSFARGAPRQPEGMLPLPPLAKVWHGD